MMRWRMGRRSLGALALLFGLIAGYAPQPAEAQVSFTQITNSTEGNKSSTSINSDGTRIAFRSVTGGKFEIFLWTQGSGITQITNSTEGNKSSTSINSDGTRIAFESTNDLIGGNPDGSREIFLWTQGSGITQITNTSGGFSTPEPSINSDGTRIAFSSDRNLTGGNADGNEEIFQATLAQPVSLELIDASNFLSGADITIDPERLATGGRLVSKVTADGVTKALIRLNVGRPGSARFALQGTGLSDNDGTLRSIDGSQVGGTITVNTVATSFSEKAFVVYESPERFVRPGIVGDEGVVQRVLGLNLDFLPSGIATSTQSIANITLVRPPIILVHGLWSNRKQAWVDSHFESELRNALPGIRLFGPSYPNAKHFSANSGVILNEILNAKRTLHGEGIAVTQVDLFGHSMGGLLSRIWAGASQYRRSTNYNEGDINKLVTIDSPHDGSYFANAVIVLLTDLAGSRPLDAALLIVAARAFGYPLDEGAVEDLMTISPAIAAINAAPTNAPSHAIIGDFVWEVDLSLLPGTLGDFFKVLKLFNFNTSPDIIPGSSDLLITTANQSGGLTSPASSTFNHFHTGATSNPAVVDQAIELLNAAPDQDLFRRGFPTGVASLIAASAQPTFFTSLRKDAARSATNSLTVSTGVNITAPPDASTVSPGQVVTVTVEPVDGFVPVSVLLVTPILVQELTTAPFSFTIAIPTEAAGPMIMLALGKDAAGTIVSDEITVSIQPTATLQSLNLDSTVFGFFVMGSQKQITVSGVYADGVERDITGMGTGTTYLSSDPAIVTVDVNGLIEAKGNGATTVVASNSGIFASIDATVDATLLTSNAGPDMVVNEGATVILDGTQSLSPDGTPLAYQWTQTSGPAVTLTGATTATPSFSAPAVSADTLLAFSLVVNDGSANSDPDSITVLVHSVPLAILTHSLPAGEQGAAYRYALQAEGGTPPYTWSLGGGRKNKLPQGLALTVEGTLTGIPTKAKTATFTVQVADAAGASATQNLSLQIVKGVKIKTKKLRGGTVGTPYSSILKTAGGISPLAFSLVGGALPPGLTLDPGTRQVSGTPAAAGIFDFVVQVTSSADSSNQRSIRIKIK
ncbi:MAG TPA: putative Ig domain-containing protein [Patescibacteria group bacterium]|nr:putative Ig domain-containing protein [Patescibacteria group bacterium]